MSLTLNWNILDDYWDFSKPITQRNLCSLYSIPRWKEKTIEEKIDFVNKSFEKFIHSYRNLGIMVIQ